MACIGCCSGAGGYIVAMLLCPVREKVRPAQLDVGASAKKFAQRAENTPILVFLGLLGEFFRGSAAGGAALGDFSCGLNRGGAALGEFFRAYRHRGQVIQVTWHLHAGNSGGFALREAFWLRVVGVSDAHVVQIPRLVGECEGCGAHSADHLGEKC